MTIERITCGETLMEEVTIDGPDTTSVVRVFIALCDLAGAEGIKTPGLPEKVPNHLKRFRRTASDNEETMP